MNNLLKKLKLVQSFESVILLKAKTADDFYEELVNNIDPEKPGFLNQSTDVFSDSPTKFRGTLENNTMRFKYKRTLFSGLLNYPVAVAHFREQKDRILIDTTISGHTGVFAILFWLIIVALIANPILLLIQSGDNSQLLLTTTITSLFMLLFLYLIMRWSVSLLRNKIDELLYTIPK